MKLIKDIISDMKLGKPQSTIPLIHVTSDFLKSAATKDSRLFRELALCRRHKIEVHIIYDEKLSMDQLRDAKKLLKDIPLFSQKEA